MSKVLFPRRPDSHPMIYAYEENNPRYEGLLKVGYTTIGVEKRVAQQYPTKRPDETPIVSYSPNLQCIRTVAIFAIMTFTAR